MRTFRNHSPLFPSITTAQSDDQLRLGDHEVYERRLRSDLVLVLRVGELGLQVQPESRVVLEVLLILVDDHDATSMCAEAQ